MLPLDSSDRATLSPEQQFEQDIALVMQNAIARHHDGAFDDAKALYEAILDAIPAHAEANYNLAVLLVDAGRATESIPYFETALGANPGNGQCWVGYINALYRANQMPAAWVAVEMAQQRGVHGPALDGLISQMATPDVTLPTAPAASPVSQASITLNISSQPRLQPDENGPVEPVRKAPLHKLQKHAALFDKNRSAEALALARQLVADYPNDGASLRALAISLYRNRQYDEMIDIAYRALESLPDDYLLRTLLADTLRLMTRLQEAEIQCRAIIATQPTNVEAHRVLGTALHGLRRQQEAVAACRRAVELAPHAASANGALGFVLLDQGAAQEAVPWLRRAIEIDPNDCVSHSSLLFSLIHDDTNSPEMLLKEHRAFGKRHERHALPRKFTNSRDPERPLRIGFVSGDLLNHAVAHYLLPIIEHLSRDPNLSLHFYYNYVVEDHVTAKLHAHATTWHAVMTLGDAALAEQIRNDCIDVLIDLSGHTGRNRLVALARKPAPLQASWIGYPGTTGMNTIDYYLSDGIVTPAGELDDQFVEKIVRMPALAPYAPPANCPPVNGLPALHNGHITYGSFNRLNKLRQDVIALWAVILRAKPDARMVIGAIEQDRDRETIAGWFAAEGIDPARLTFQPRTSVPVYLQQHHRVDICLDTFPYAGSTTTLNALWMGVPTVTLAGMSLPTRGSASWLKRVDLEDFIAHDKDEFVRKAITLTDDLDTLQTIRNGLRERCLASAPFHPDVVAQGLSVALRMMWRRWCAGEAPVSFDAILPDQSTSTPAEQTAG
ncbi:tetratricopeptide repeat protein [Burkholderia cepacia]|uniref:protein O-GlcNAc transferase n=1 Tax=Burkholderia cepacia TaxID=292 RepID=A0AAX2RI56_BURCE|nr:tetratricopeptide repeat protein [Burkholderia cepacia]TES71130.1 tetratricopeptide repeat protein [Burkholderia cepacia]TES98418.1 tetratricopeptide repeat protein [Burkholderia cepacia]TEU36043.1 tetratricopeptide repeat protein [Burkholderia cepacia]TEU39046.1 tetratricopeptide repeat protein [Burkholderia cepacia]TEU47276.1 tetratricopeptide repeat protein [Burkholderia cepacia]